MRSRMAIALAGALVATPVGVLVGAPAQAAPSRAELALRWAPIHYQDVDTTGSHALAGKADFITRYDFDGNLNGRDNWDNAGRNTSAAAYYSVSETSTHWYLTYFFFHPATGWTTRSLKPSTKTAARASWRSSKRKVERTAE